MNIATFRKPTEADVEFVTMNMRHEDRRELRRWTGQEPAYELRHSISMSDSCYAGIASTGEVLSIFGICRVNIIEGTGIIWSLSTTAVNKHPIEFYRSSKVAIEKLFQEFPDIGIFYNYVDSEYQRAINWLEHLGFSKSIEPMRKGLRGGKFAELYAMNPHHKED